MACLSAYMYRQISKCTDKTPKSIMGGGGGGRLRERGYPTPTPPPPIVSDSHFRGGGNQVIFGKPVDLGKALVKCLGKRPQPPSPPPPPPPERNWSITPMNGCIRSSGVTHTHTHTHTSSSSSSSSSYITVVLINS